jgi:uncharacterized protein DUF3489
MTTQLTPSQQQILSHAAQSASGKLDWFPDNIKGGARKKVIDSMSNRALITQLGEDWFVAPEGYDALGLPHPRPVTVADPEIEAAVTAIETTARAKAKTPRTRGNSKQAQVIAMLKRPEGATIPQICEVTGWQSHTVRGTFAGAFKKKLGLDVTSTKGEGDRVYRIAD